MSQPVGAGILNSLKNKMQHLREELEKYKDLYEEKCQEVDEERNKRQDVGVPFMIVSMTVGTLFLLICL